MGKRCYYSRCFVKVFSVIIRNGDKIKMLMWLFILIAVLAALIGGIAYLVSRFYKIDLIRKVCKDKKSKKIIFSLFIICVIGIALTLVFSFVNAIVSIIYLTFFWIISDLLFYVIYRISNKKISYNINSFVAIISTVVYLATAWYLCNNVWKEQYTLHTQKKVEEMKILQFADSHIGATFDGDGFSKEVDRMANEEVDIVLITGDFVDDGTTREDMIKACDALSKFDTKYGVYFSFGNHDKGYYNNSYRGFSAEELIDRLEKNNVIVLQDEVVQLSDDYYLIGRKDRVEEQNGNGRKSMSELTNKLDRDKYIIVMDHQPHDYEAQKEAKVDLVLSGHTHGGQLFPINNVGKWIGENDNVYGKERRNITDFIVTSGIADWELVYKSGCKSEYVVIDIKNE